MSDKNQLYQDLIKKIEKEVKIFSQESCIIVYNYLYLYGKKNYHQILADIDLGRATVFKALALLQEIGYVEKIIDKEITDKRKQNYYFAREVNIEIDENQEFFTFLIENKKLDLYKEWLQNSVTFSTKKIESCYKYVINKKIKRFNKKKAQKETQEKKLIVTFNNFLSIKDQNQFNILTVEYLHAVQQLHQNKRNNEDPLENPTLFSLYLIPM